MEPCEAFKIGFMSRCIEEGLSQEKTAEAIEKSAETLEALVEAAKAVAYPAMGAAILAPPTIGGLAAYFNNRALDTSDEGDVDEIKNRELRDSYRRAARQLQEIKRGRSRKAESKRSGQVFL